MKPISKDFEDIYSCINDLQKMQKNNEKKITELENRLIRETVKNSFLKEAMGKYIDLISEVLAKHCSASKDKAEIEQILMKAEYPLINLHDEDIFKIVNILFHGKCVKARFGTLPYFDLLCIWGFPSGFVKARFLKEAIIGEKPLIYLEDGFIRSIVPVNNKKVAEKYRIGHSIIIDNRGLHINAKWESRLENLLNSNIELTQEQLQRSRKLINSIVKNKISKYNHRPIFAPQIGSEGRKKVLVIDQVEGDQSIYYGLANEETFANMLHSAIKENPEADIIVKTHPATKGFSKNGFYQSLEDKKIYKITYEINPISLLEYVDKVYVCTSQMGFEAVLCGKEVHVFGMPFYAGWGVTTDRQTCARRTRGRTVEELFYIIYIMYSKYISYKTETICEIEQVIQDILELRNDYFNPN